MKIQTALRTAICTLHCFLMQPVLATDFLITDFGARPGNTINTIAINKAIDACHKNGGGRVVIPAGTFRSGTLMMKDNVALYLEPGSVLLASDQLKDFPVQ